MVVWSAQEFQAVDPGKAEIWWEVQNNTFLSGGAGISLSVFVCQALLGATGEPWRPRTPVTHQLHCPCSLLLVGNIFPVDTARPKNADAVGEKGQMQADPDSHTTAPVVKSTTWELVKGVHKRCRNFCISVTLLPLPMPVGRDVPAWRLLEKWHCLSLAL